MNTVHPLFNSDDHGFSPLHWAAKEGHLNLVTLLIQRGARVNATNMGDDTPLHLATAHGHRDIVNLVKPSLSKLSVDLKLFLVE